MMKIAPVPLFTVIDGLEGDLEAVGVYERLNFLAKMENMTPAYMAHAMRFCASAMTAYTSSAKKITVSAAAFATLPSQADKTWALGRILTLCPLMPARVQGQGPGTMDPQMLMLMQQMISQQMSSGVKAPGSAAVAEDQCRRLGQKILGIETKFIEIRFRGFTEFLWTAGKGRGGLPPCVTDHLRRQ